MKPHRIILHNDAFINRAKDYLSHVKIDSKNIFEVVIKPYIDARNLNQNALYWKWLSLTADHFNNKSSHQYDKDEMHDLMRHLHLGYEDIKVGSTLIKGQLRSTTNLDRGQMSEYMQKIEAWTADHDLLLPIPDEKQYEEWAKYR